MRTFQLIFVAISACIYFCGCDRDRAPYTGGDSPPMSLMIWMETDTVKFCPGDTATANGVVTVSSDGRAFRNIPVDISVGPNDGFIEYTNPVLRDTTDHLGRVTFRFQCFERTGVFDVVAKAAGGEGKWPLVVQRESEGPYCFHVTVEPDTLWLFPGQQDSSLVTVCLVDSARRNPIYYPCWRHQGIEHVSLHLQATGGSFGPLPPFDSTSCSSTWWYFRNTSGTFYVSVPLMCDELVSVFVGFVHP